MGQVEFADGVAGGGSPFADVEFNEFGIGAAEPLAADGVALDNEAGDVAGSDEFLVNDGVDARSLRGSLRSLVGVLKHD